MTVEIKVGWDQPPGVQFVDTVNVNGSAAQKDTISYRPATHIKDT